MQTALTRSHSVSSLSEFSGTLTGKIVFGIAATAVVAAAAHVAVPLPFTPVPFILTPLAVLGVGLAFGPIGGLLVMLAYLAEGAAGLPVFSPTGMGGMTQFLGPTGGYLMSYPLVAFLAGGITRALQGRMSKFVAATVAGIFAIALLFTFGAAWMSFITHLSAHQIWIAAVAPFLPGEAFKVLCAAGLYRAFSREARA